MSNELGYSDAEANDVYNDVDFFSDIRSAIKKHSGEELDIKPYEADMMHLIDTYIEAKEPRRISSLEKVRNIKYEIINSGGVSISLYELAKNIITLTGSNSDIILKDDKPMSSFQLSMIKSKQIFNHNPQRLEDSLNEIINIMKQH